MSLYEELLKKLKENRILGGQTKEEFIVCLSETQYVLMAQLEDQVEKEKKQYEG